MSATQTEDVRHFTFNAKMTPDFVPSNHMDSLKTISQEKKLSQHKRPNTACNLPVNLFHSPGEYNKMLIRCTPPELGSYVERKMGLVKNLEFVNQPLFEREKQKRYQRVNDYCQSMRIKHKETKSENASSSGPCKCCCCDNFCSECAKTTVCEFSCKQKSCKDQKMLIDIPAMKAAAKNKIKKSYQSIEAPSKIIEDVHFCCKPTKDKRFHINQLINQTVMKQIEKKREKQLSQLSVKQREQLRQEFNNMVRENNKKNTISRSSLDCKVKSLPKSKKALGEEYWNQIKDLVSMQFRKQKIEKSSLQLLEKLKVQPEEDYVCLKKSSRNLTKQYIEQKRRKNGKKALKEQRKSILQQREKEKRKAKSLLALAAQQEQIIKTNPKKKFKPTKDMVQNAFKDLD